MHVERRARVHSAGKKAYSLYLPEAITCMELLALKKTRTAKALIVGLANGDVRLYHEKHLVAQLRINEPVTALRFGPTIARRAALRLWAPPAR